MTVRTMADVNLFGIHFSLILYETAVAATVDFHDPAPIHDAILSNMCRKLTYDKKAFQILAMTGLGQTQKSSVGLGMSGVGGIAEVDFGRLEVRL